MGRWIDTPKGKILLALNLAENKFEWLDKSLQSQSQTEIFNKRLSSFEQELVKYPASLGLHTEKIGHPLHFEIPDYKIESIKEDDLSFEQVSAWIYIRELANNSCLSLLG